MKTIRKFKNGVTIGHWKTGIQYNLNDLIFGSNNLLYKCIQVCDSKDPISELNYWKQVKTEQLGVPTDGSFLDGMDPFTPVTKIVDAIDKLNERILLLAPEKPANLDTKAIDIENHYKAYWHDSVVEHQSVVDSQSPQSKPVDDFFDGEHGVLTALVNAVDKGNKTLSEADDVGVYGDLNITADEDPYLGQPGKEGFWRQLRAYINISDVLAYDVVHKIQLSHSLTGVTNEHEFWVDDPGLVTIGVVSQTLPAACTRFISGVPSLANNDVISSDFAIVNAVRKHYTTNKIAILESLHTTALSIDSAGPYAEGADINLVNQDVNVSNKIYTEDIELTYKGANSKNIFGTLKNQLTGARADTISDESSRVVSGSGLYPAAGYGGAFNSNTSLKTVYIEELQKLNDLYQAPVGDYTANLPTAGENYNAGMGVLDRWVTFQPIIGKLTSLTITFLDPAGTWVGIETAGIKIQVKCEGITGWLDANAADNCPTAPVNDGDPCLDLSKSSIYQKVTNFCDSSYDGTWYVRIGLPVGSDKMFSGVSAVSS